MFLPAFDSRPPLPHIFAVLIGIRVTGIAAGSPRDGEKDPDRAEGFKGGKEHYGAVSERGLES